MPERAAVIAPERLRADVAYVRRLLEEVHPDPVPPFPLTEIAPELRALQESVDAPASPAELYRRLAPVVTALGDDHVRLNPPGPLQQAYDSSDGRFPLEVRVIRERLYVMGARAGSSELNRAPELRRGAAIISINGVPAGELLDRLLRYHAGTGPAQREYQLEQSFGRTLFAVYGWISSYRLSVRTPGATSVSELQVHGAGESDRPEPAFVWERLENNTLLFTYNRFKDPEGSFDSFLAELFETARVEEVSHLVIDLRRNEGGSSSFGDKVLAYLSGEPFLQLTRSEIRVSEEVRREFMSYVPGFLRWVPLQYIHPLLRPLWTTEIGGTATVSFDRVAPREPQQRFTGRVTLLIGPGTMSSASLFAATVREYGIGTLVGRPAGGYATHYGNVIETQLPHSGLPLDMATSVNYGHSTGPIRPDHRVELRPEDVAAGRDPALAFALQMAEWTTGRALSVMSAL